VTTRADGKVWLGLAAAVLNASPGRTSDDWRTQFAPRSPAALARVRSAEIERPSASPRCLPEPGRALPDIGGQIYDWSENLTCGRFPASGAPLPSSGAVPRPARHGGAEGIVITKHGKPVAKLIPLGTESKGLIGSLAGKLRIRGKILSTGIAWDAESRHARPASRARR
jgi:antitoxin (DNA-binding transcriptional repressor) of toxin-antitoxin stability system